MKKEMKKKKETKWPPPMEAEYVTNTEQLDKSKTREKKKETKWPPPMEAEYVTKSLNPIPLEKGKSRKSKRFVEDEK